MKGVEALPASVSHGIGHVGTWLAHHLMRGSTRALHDNLRVLFPERSDRAVRQLALLTYRSYARDTIAFIQSLSLTDRQLQGQMSSFDATSFERALAAGRGAIAVSAHFGCWELGGMLLRRLCGYPVTLVVMAERSPTVDRLRHQLRASFEIETLEIRRSLDTALRIRRRLAENRVVAMLIDRHLGKDRVPVEFFGRQSHFLRTPALLAALTGAPLVPSFVYRHESGSLMATCGAPIHLGRGVDRDREVRQAVQRFAQLLETEIRQRPHYWYQFYPFWSTQPDEDHHSEALTG